jgi:hypothetical protein
MQEYKDLNKEFKIAAVTNSGKFIILEDGSKWETFSFRGENNAAFWQENSPLYITLCSYSRYYSYYLKNLDENEKVRAFFIGYVKTNE